MYLKWLVLDLGPLSDSLEDPLPLDFSLIVPVITTHCLHLVQILILSISDKVNAVGNKPKPSFHLFIKPLFMFSWNLVSHFFFFFAHFVEAHLKGCNKTRKGKEHTCLRSTMAKEEWASGSPGLTHSCLLRCQWLSLGF